MMTCAHVSAVILSSLLQTLFRAFITCSQYFASLIITYIAKDCVADVFSTCKYRLRCKPGLQCCFCFAAPRCCSLIYLQLHNTSLSATHERGCKGDFLCRQTRPTLSLSDCVCVCVHFDDFSSIHPPSLSLSLSG